jgi:hypothetical protein
MNVELGAEATQFPEKEHMGFSLQCELLTSPKCRVCLGTVLINETHNCSPVSIFILKIRFNFIRGICDLFFWGGGVRPGKVTYGPLAPETICSPVTFFCR